MSSNATDWIGSYGGASKKAPGTVTYLKDHLKYRKYDFPGSNFSRGDIKDAIIEAFMEWRHRKGAGKMIFAKLNFRELLLEEKKEEEEEKEGRR